MCVVSPVSHGRDATRPPRLSTVTAAALTSPAAARAPGHDRPVRRRRCHCWTACLTAGALCWVRRGEGLRGPAARPRGWRSPGRTPCAEAARVVGVLAERPARSTRTSASPAPRPRGLRERRVSTRTAGASVFRRPGGDRRTAGRRGLGHHRRRRRRARTSAGDAPGRFGRRHSGLRYADGALRPRSRGAPPWPRGGRPHRRRGTGQGRAGAPTCSCHRRRAAGPAAASCRSGWPTASPDCWTFAVDGLLGAGPSSCCGAAGRPLSARVARRAPRRGARQRRPAPGRRADQLGAGPRRAPSSRIDSLVAARSSPYLHDLWTRPARARAARPGRTCAHLATDVAGARRRRGPRAGAGLLELIGAVHGRRGGLAGRQTRADGRTSSASSRRMDRGRYARVRWAGWTPAATGEFGLALRCAELVGDDSARLFAGCGVVAGSVTERRSWRRPSRSWRRSSGLGGLTTGASFPSERDTRFEWRSSSRRTGSGSRRWPSWVSVIEAVVVLLDQVVLVAVPLSCRAPLRLRLPRSPRPRRGAGVPGSASASRRCRSTSPRPSVSLPRRSRWRRTSDGDRVVSRPSSRALPLPRPMLGSRRTAVRRTRLWTR